MKKLSLVLAAAAIVLMCCAPAFAGSEIDLGSSGSGAPVKFVGTGGGNFNVTFTVQNLHATGFGTLDSTGFYSIANGGNSLYSMGSCGTGCFNLAQNGPLAFKYGSIAGGSDLLTGDLYFTSIVQSTTGGGIFNDTLLINFVATGGGLQSAFATGNGIVQLTIKFTTNKDLATLLTGQQLTAKITSGVVFPVPEPGSLSLLSGGLLGLAVLCKNRLFA